MVQRKEFEGVHRLSGSEEADPRLGFPSDHITCDLEVGRLLLLLPAMIAGFWLQTCSLGNIGQGPYLRLRGGAFGVRRLDAAFLSGALGTEVRARGVFSVTQLWRQQA